MAKTNNIIELNGKRFDAVTGKMLGQKPENPDKVAIRVAHTVKKPGVAAHRRVVAETVNVKVSAAATTHMKAMKSPGMVMDIRRQPAGHIKHHKPEPSKTLMRKVVKKPEPSLKRHVKTQPRTDILAKVPEHVVTPKASMHHIDTTRLKRAEHTAKSTLVSRFGAVEAPTTAHTAHIAEHVKHDVDAVIASVSGELESIKPVFASNAAARPSMDVFEQALARANSHKETYIDPKKAHKAAKRSHRGVAKRLARNGSLALAVLLMAGFIAYQNTANLTMRVASTKAGFNANMPGFKPSGFAVGKFSYGAGFVAVNYHSNSDNRAFTLTQKISNWDSAALLNEFVANAQGDSYQTLEASGRTIYTYGNNNATWVDHGVWFNVESNGSLSTTQLVNLATSM